MTHPHQHDSKLIWELAENEDNRNRARVFERDWHESYRMAGYRPAIEDYLPEESLERQGALLALARVDMACRFDTEDTPRVEDYLHLLEYEELTPEFVAGLAFEEYILRLENDEKPKLSEYRKRFPGAVRIIQELFLIQEAVAGEEFDQEEEAQKQQYDGYPEAGQSIEGFQLVHEIGSGSYAKVYLAQDSTLAGREVALKVTRGHHSEWLTLAKLQHTYIVPIYSYKQTIYEENRFDMVCMPYFGRVTLNILIDHENWGQCIDGSDIQKLVDSLQPESLLDETRDSSSRSRLAEMTFAQAVAWWGTCLADAMRHAHERRILHRDIKPTNILITPDCEPMLLDFNLAKETLISLASDETSQTEESPAEDSIGGTLAYMAPEHLEAMISGQTRLVDQRADIYSLGAVLYEALTRSDVMKKTHAPAKNKAEMLRQTLELRKLPPMSVRDLAPDVPLVLDRVIRKCLDPDPARRYLTAAQLGEDLKAVALDQPVRHAQEPISNRLRRNLKRNRKVLVSIVLMSVIMFFGPGLSLYRKLEQQRIAELSREAREDLQSSRTARLAGDFLNAQNLQHRVMRTLSDTPSLAPIYHQATQELELTKVMEQSRALAQKFFDDSGLLRYSTIHSTRLGGELDPDGIGLAISRVVKPILQLLDRMDTRSNSTLSDASPSFLTFLEPGQINEIRHWVELLMFEGVCAQFKANQDDTLRSGLKLSMSLASRFEPGLPWTILNERLSAALERRPVNELNWPEPDQESSAIACLEFADLAMLDGLTDRAMQWVRRAIALRPADPWIHHELALILERRGEYAAAIDRLEIAKSLNQQNVWASLELARLARVQGQYAQAFEEIHFIRQLSHNLETNHDLNAFIDLEQGLVEQGLGNFETSESLLHSIVYDKNTSSSIKLLGAQSLSEILLSKGRWTDLQYLLDEFETEDDGQTSWALIRSRLLLGQNRHEEALLCLDRYLISNPEVIKAREMRAQILLKSGKVQQALEESQEIVRRSDTPLHRRQLERCRIAVLAELSPEDPEWFASLVALRLNDPESVQLSPWMTSAVINQVIRNFETFDRQRGQDHPLLKVLQSRFYLNLAILKSSIGKEDWQECLQRSLNVEDTSILTIRSQVMVLIHQKLLDRARDLVEYGLNFSFEDPQLIDLRAKISHESGDYSKALREYDELLKVHENHVTRAWRAKTLIRLGRWNEALADLSRALMLDPFHPDWRVERALIWKRLNRSDLAISDLYMASIESRENPLLSTRLAMIQAVVASKETGDKLEQDDLLKQLMRASWPEVFNRAGLNDLELKTDSAVKQAVSKQLNE